VGTRILPSTPSTTLLFLGRRIDHTLEVVLPVPMERGQPYPFLSLDLGGLGSYLSRLGERAVGWHTLHTRVIHCIVG